MYGKLRVAERVDHAVQPADDLLLASSGGQYLRPSRRRSPRPAPWMASSGTKI